MRLASTIAAGALLLAACTAQTGGGSSAPSSGGLEITVSQTDAGDALAGADGKTLYVFKADTNGTSTCTDSCANTWPPLLGDGSEVNAGAGVTGTFGTTTRDDGSTQVTHGGSPLYYYSGDQAAGDSNGDGIGGLWSIAPVGAAAASPGSSGGETESAAPSYGGPGY